MSKLVFALLLVISLRATESFKLSIINGKATEIVQFPWQAVFMWRGYFMCGAVVICEKLVRPLISWTFNSQKLLADTCWQLVRQLNSIFSPFIKYFPLSALHKWIQHTNNDSSWFDLSFQRRSNQKCHQTNSTSEIQCFHFRLRSHSLGIRCSFDIWEHHQTY